jgi:O-acetyl-ADP-ribose deacetylase (regulator of RNase III)
MIQVKYGNLLNVESGIVVQGCNCQGVMGSGLAKSIKDRWPSVFEAYQLRYRKGGLFLGDVVAVGGSSFQSDPLIHRHLTAVGADLPGRLIVANAMTQYFYGREPGVVYADYSAIFAAFARIRLLAEATGLPVHIPLIGCGLAKGEWAQVSPRIQEGLGPEVDCTLWQQESQPVLF